MACPQLRTTIFISATFGVLLTFVALVMAGGGLLTLWKGGFIMWILLPFSALFAARRLASSHEVLFTVAIISVICAFSTLLYADMFIRPDAQSPLLFLFLPICQLTVILSSIGIAALVSAKRRSSV